MFKIDQGIILSYHNDEPRVCDVLQIPDNYVMSNVRLPSSVGWQTKPLEKSVVLVASPDSYKSFIICVLREPEDFLELGEGVRGSKEVTGTYLQPGEIQLEAAGDPTAQISGTGGSLYLSNDGTVNLSSGKRKEYLILGGTDSDDDGEVLLVGDNGFFESNINHLTQVRSSYTFNEQNKLTLGNHFVIVTPISETATPISTLEMTTLGKITLQNYAVGVPNASLDMGVTGEIVIKNNLAQLQLSPAGAISATGLSLSITTTGTISQTGTTINLNNGTFGVARIQDTVTSTIATDPAWWLFWSTVGTLIGSLPTTPADGGSTLKAGLAALFSTVPQTIVSKITTGSLTVKAGG